MSDETLANNDETAQQAETTPVFHVEKLYLKDLSFENPNAPEIFRENTEPQVDFNLETGATQKGPEHFEATLHVTVKMVNGERTLFLVELTFAGLFLLRNMPRELIAPMLGIECPSILFPYARHLVSEMITQGGFRPIVLDPINFSALYHQSRSREAASQ
ncbi:MAG: protein-export chaperone SecB [Magnetococcales bacterium]|nr:protein-export chaperone SecB [Magnetococcales bacterium]